MKGENNSWRENQCNSRFNTRTEIKHATMPAAPQFRARSAIGPSQDAITNTSNPVPAVAASAILAILARPRCGRKSVEGSMIGWYYIKRSDPGKGYMPQNCPADRYKQDRRPQQVEREAQHLVRQCRAK